MKSGLILHSDATLIDALRAIDAGAAGICCVVDGESHLVGVVTDGDVRRALIGGSALSDPVWPVVQRKPKVAREGTSRALILDLMAATRITAVPEVSDEGHVVAVHTLNSVLGAKSLRNIAVIMAGGKGTRLGELTRSTPKPLLPVAGRPIIEWIVLQLVGAGVTDIFVSINHLGDQIEARLGDGRDLGCRVHYLRESADKPLGTAGSLTLLAPEHTAEGAPPIIVVNGDLMLEFDAGRLVEEHLAAGAQLTVGTTAYQHRVPFGVVSADADGRVLAIEEKPVIDLEVNSALYCVEASAVRLLVPGEPSGMPDLIRRCVEEHRLVKTWPVADGWIDIGTPSDFARARGGRV